MNSCFVGQLSLFVAISYSADASSSYKTGIPSIVLANVSWIEARRQCLIDNGQLVDVSCNAFHIQHKRKVWIQGHKIASWILSKGCYIIEGINNNHTHSLAECLSNCKTKNIGFNDVTSLCFCLEKMPQKNVNNGVCKSTSVQQIYQSFNQPYLVYQVSDVDVYRNDLNWKNSDCVGIYIKCKRGGVQFIPDDCKSSHILPCGKIPQVYGTQADAEQKCAHNASERKLNTFCQQLPDESGIWTTLKRIWHIPFGSNGNNNPAAVRNCSYIECQYNSVTTPGISRNCDDKLDGYACRTRSVDQNNRISSKSSKTSSTEATKAMSTKSNSASGKLTTHVQQSMSFPQTTFSRVSPYIHTNAWNFTSDLKNTMTSRLSASLFIAKIATNYVHVTSRTTSITKDVVNISSDNDHIKDNNRYGLILGISVAVIAICVFICSTIIIVRRKMVGINVKELDQHLDSTSNGMDIVSMDHINDQHNNRINGILKIIDTNQRHARDKEDSKHVELSTQQYDIVKKKHKHEKLGNDICVCSTDENEYNTLNEVVKSTTVDTVINVYDTTLGVRNDDDPTYSVAAHINLKLELHDDTYDMNNMPRV